MSFPELAVLKVVWILVWACFVHMLEIMSKERGSHDYTAEWRYYGSTVLSERVLKGRCRFFYAVLKAVLRAWEIRPDL